MDSPCYLDPTFDASPTTRRMSLGYSALLCAPSLYDDNAPPSTQMIEPPTGSVETHQHAPLQSVAIASNSAETKTSTSPTWPITQTPIAQTTVNSSSRARYEQKAPLSLTTWSTMDTDTSSSESESKISSEDDSETRSVHHKAHDVLATRVPLLVAAAAIAAVSRSAISIPVTLVSAVQRRQHRNRKTRRRPRRRTTAYTPTKLFSGKTASVEMRLQSRESLSPQSVERTRRARRGSLGLLRSKDLYRGCSSPSLDRQTRSRSRTRGIFTKPKLRRRSSMYHEQRRQKLRHNGVIMELMRLTESKTSDAPSRLPLKAWKILGLNRMRSHRPKPKHMASIRAEAPLCHSPSLTRLEMLDTGLDFAEIQRCASENHEDVGVQDYMNEEEDANLFGGLTTSTHSVDDLEMLLRHPLFFDHFFRFCQLRHAEESLLFWHSVERFKADYETYVQNRHSASSSTLVYLLEMVKRDAFVIFDTFVDEEALYCVNISSTTVEELRSGLKALRRATNETVDKLASELFEESQREILTLLQQDPFVRFRASPLWSALRRDTEVYLGLSSRSLDHYTS